jgi:hypothetical protein
MDKADDPANVGFFGAEGIMFAAKSVANLVE